MRAGAVVGVAALGLALPSAALAGSAGSRTSEHVVMREAEAMNLNLRLVDLPAGYEVTSDFRVGSDGACDRNVDHTRGTADLSSPSHVACKLTFGDSWRPPGVSRPEAIESAVLRFDDVAGATAGFRSREQLAFDLFDGAGEEKRSERVPTTPLGDESRVRSWDGGVRVTWRTGQTLSFIQTTRHWSPPPSFTPLIPPLPPPPSRPRRRLPPPPPPAPPPKSFQQTLERAALRYAARQQARVVNPAPLLPSDNDDAEVALDSPRLQVDVHWLGRRLEPGGALPPLDLFDSEWSYTGGEGPGSSAELLYVGNDGYVSLSLWTVRAWKRYRRGIVGKRVFDFPCTKPTVVPTSRGRAVVRSTRNSRGASCESGPARRIRSPDCSIDPDPNARIRRCYARPGKHFLATVHLKEVVVAVNAPICVFCVLGSEYGAFNSAAGMRAVVQGLRSR